jgi:hypothetical protein
MSWPNSVWSLTVLSLLLPTLAGTEAPLPRQSNAALTEKYALSLLKDPRFEPPPGWKWGFFKNADHALLRFGWCAAATALHGTIVMLPGYQSTIEQYFETARDFQVRGFDIWMFDWRGKCGT